MESFDLVNWLRMGENRLEEIEKEVADIEEEIEAAEAKKDELYEERARISEALGKAEPTPPNGRQRRVMIRPLIFQVLHETKAGDKGHIDDIIEMVQEQRPEISASKIRGALLRLSREDPRVTIDKNESVKFTLPEE